MNYSEHYKTFHPDTARHRDVMTKYYQNNLSYLKSIDKSSKILEIGSGGGYAVLALQKMGFRDIFSYDIDDGQVKLAERNGVKSAHMTEDQANNYLDSNNNHFDVVIAFDVLEHIPDEFADEFIRRIYNAKKQNGIAILQVPNAFSPAAAQQRYIDLTHCTIYSTESLTHRARMAGFSEIKIISSINPSAIGLRQVLKKFTLLPISRLGNFIWRIIQLEHFGLSALQKPISKNIIMVAK